MILKLGGAVGVVVWSTHSSSSAPRWPGTACRSSSNRRIAPSGHAGAAPPSEGDRPDDAGRRDLVRLQPVAHPEVLLGLTAMSIIRGLQGFQIFLLAFGLRRLNVASTSMAWP